MKNSANLDYSADASWIILYMFYVICTSEDRSLFMMLHIVERVVKILADGVF